ncbi:MAG: hypothetical protein ACRCTZ_07665 [Sarcina sp.]
MSKKTKTIKNKEKGNKAFANTRTLYNIPTFTYKSAFMLIGAATVGCLIVPLLLGTLGFDSKLIAVLGGIFIAPLGIAISRCFIESKEGFGKKFFQIYLGFGLALGFISVFWIYFENYI